MFGLLLKGLIFAVITIGSSIFVGSKIEQYYPATPPTPTSTPTSSVTPTSTQVATTAPRPKTQATPAPKAANTETIVEGKTSWTYGKPDERMATAGELFDAINSYKRTNGLPEISQNGTLCQIAQNRANELVDKGELDGHAGFEKYARGQQEFDSMDEILFGGVMPQLAVHIVEWGWDKSLTGHRNALQNREYTHGCGGIAGYFAVFIFGGGHIN